MTLAIFQPEIDKKPIMHAFAAGESDVWTFYKIGKRGGKLYRNQQGTTVYESNLPAGAKKVERELTVKEQAKQNRIDKKERRKALRVQREAEQATTSPRTQVALPLSPEEKTKAQRKLARLHQLGMKAAEKISYSTRQALQAKKQAFIEAATALRGKDQGTAVQRAKKAGIALSKAAFASYHLHAKRYGKPLAVLIEGVKATVNLAVSTPFIVVPGAGAFIRNSITGPAVDYVARKTAKQVIHLRQLARGRWKPQQPRQFSESPGAGPLDFDVLARVILTSIHVDAIKARVSLPKVSIHQVAHSLASLLNSVAADEHSQRKAA